MKEEKSGRGSAQDMLKTENDNKFLKFILKINF